MWTAKQQQEHWTSLQFGSRMCLTTWRVPVQVGDLFRTRAFNFHARKAAPPRSLDTLTLRELYALKTETTNRALSAKMLADLYRKLENIHVQSTCRINTPLITKCLQSPTVSKNAALAEHRAAAPKQASQYEFVAL